MAFILTAPPVPPVAEGVRPPTIGSKYLAPEFDAVDESEVLGPPVPAGSHDAPAAEAPGRDDDRRQEPVSQTDAMEEVRDAVAEPLADPDEAPGSNPLITPEAVARPVTPPASAIEHSPARRACAARCSATSDEEQAVSTETVGPWTPKV